MPIPNPELRILPDGEALARAAAQDWVDLARSAIDRHGEFRVSLSGGSTPRRLFEILTEGGFAADIDWRRVRIVFGDERCVPADHPDSNYRMARESLFDPLGIPEERIERVRTELGHAEAALDYERRLTTSMPGLGRSGCRGLDLVMLGLGPDGHIASLFPDTPILSIRDRIAADVYVEKFSSWRVSLTYPVIEQAGRIMLLAAGEGKEAIVTAVLGREDDGPPRYPVERLRPRGQATWYLDAAAAAGLATAGNGR